MLKPSLPAFAMLAAAIGAVPAASAAPGDEGLDLIAGLGWFRDDNLFRLPDGQPGFGNRRSDAARHAHAGLLFNKTWSRQKLYAQAKVTQYDFQHFDQLDHDAKEAQLRWNWTAGNRFEGMLGASYVEALAPYTDFRSSQRNLRTHRRDYAEAAWKPAPAWRARAAAARDRFSYELPAQRFNDRTEDAAEIGADWLPRSGSTVGMVARRVRGSYANPRLFGGLPRDESFEQDELKARINWLASGSTTVNLLAGHARRRYTALGERDASGFNGRVTAIHQPRGKLRITAAAWREFAAVESNVVSYSLNRGASLGATWEHSAKVRIDASASHETRRYNARVLPNAPQDLDDSLKQAQLSAIWSPRRTVAVTAALARQQRSGSPFLGLGRFTANTVSVQANVQF